MNSADSNKPIVVKRVKKYAAGAHGGAWKVAFADFVTAMMALFLVLWLIESTTPAEKMAISMYFTDPTGYTDGGSPFVINMGGGMRNTDAIDKKSSPAPATQEPDVNPDKNLEANMSKEQIEEIHQQQENQKFEELKKMLEERIEADPTLGALRDQIIIKITEEGLMIEVVDKDKRPMFDSGGAVIKPYMRTILKEISKTLLDVPNKLSVSGHTDAVPFTEVENYTNWELSADRANAARRAMLKAGIKETQIARVVGLAESQLYDLEKPENPINRRISILAMRTAPERIKPEEEKKAAEPGKEGEASEGGFPGGVGAPENAAPGAETAPPATTPAPAVEPDLPPDADFPGGINPEAQPASGPIPESIPTVPGGLSPQPVLPAGNTGNAAPAGTSAPAAIDPFSVLPGGAGAKPVTGKGSAATTVSPAANPPPSPIGQPAPPVTPVVVPRPSNAEEEFF